MWMCSDLRACACVRVCVQSGICASLREQWDEQQREVEGTEKGEGKREGEGEGGEREEGEQGAEGRNRSTNEGAIAGIDAGAGAGR